jgi:hypothetical protein
MKRYLWLLLSLLLVVATPALADGPQLTQPEPLPIGSNGTKTITFSRAVFRVIPEIYEGSAEFILET